MDYKKHYPVFHREILEAFHIYQDLKEVLIVDMTFGAGGHSFMLLNELPNCRILAFDQDPDAIENGKLKIAEYCFGQRIKIIPHNFENLDMIKADPWFNLGAQGIVVDLGVSSHHFDSEERGFSFRFDGPLDMRMDTENNTITASQIVNEWPENELADLIYQYGEDRLSRRIAAAIVEARAKNEIKTTKDLESIIFHTYPKKMRHGSIHPATRTFQAIRIAVNDELGVIERVIPKVAPLLAKQGKFCAISFHSLEDRLIKHGLKHQAKNPRLELKILTKKPILPTEQEILENSRSRSAKLRILQRS